MEVTFFIFDLSEFMKYSFYMQAKVETTEDTFPTFVEKISFPYCPKNRRSR